MVHHCTRLVHVSPESKSATRFSKFPKKIRIFYLEKFKKCHFLNTFSEIYLEKFKKYCF